MINMQKHMFVILERLASNQQKGHGVRHTVTEVRQVCVKERTACYQDETNGPQPGGK